MWLSELNLVWLSEPNSVWLSEPNLVWLSVYDWVNLIWCIRLRKYKLFRDYRFIFFITDYRCWTYIYLFVSWHFTSKNHTTFFLLVSISLTRNIQLDCVCLLFCAPLSRNTHHVFVFLLVSVLFDYAWYPCFHFTTPFHFSFNYYLHQLHIFIFVLVTIHLLSISFYLYIYLNIHSLLSVVTLVPNCQRE